MQSRRLAKRLLMNKFQAITNVAQMEDFKQTDQALMTRIIWQLLLNLSGQANDPRKLQSELFDQGFDCENFIPERALHKGSIDFVRLELHVYFGDFEEAAKIALETGGVTKGVPGHFFGMIEAFHRGLSLYAMARKTKQRKYVKAANTITKTIDKWAQQKNPNVVHYLMLLQAEKSALEPKYHAEADSQYRKAIALASRTGQMHQSALFNERYSDFLGHRTNDKGHEYEAFQDLAQHHRTEAIRLYRDWGAYAKVDMLMSGKD